MFPEWFGPRQIDWPEQTEFAGFPLWDEKGYTAVAPELEDFLRAGEPPIVFTPGTAHTHADRFWKAAIDACQQLGRRGMLLTRHAEQIPSRLPEGVRHFDFAPFSQVLPHSAAIVHHGGIGTMSQGLAAGIPQVWLVAKVMQQSMLTRVAEMKITCSSWMSERILPSKCGCVQ
jgi:UDP:flavonoid glycosyltransferase YjiC (YdhE family)